VNGRDAVVTAARGSEGEPLVGAIEPVPQLNLGAIGRAPVADLDALAALHTDDGVLVVAAIGHSPPLIVSAAVSPLNDLGPVRGSIVRCVQGLAAMPSDDAIRAIGNRPAAATAGAGRRSASVSRQPTEIGLCAFV